MTERLRLSRAQLASFLTDPQAIKQFEGLFKAADQAIPDSLGDVSIAAEAARTASQQALEELRRIADALELLTLAPASTPHEVDALSPPIALGTLGHQNADHVSITGGEVIAALTGTQTTLIATSVALSDGAAAALGTLTNAPVSGNPTKWVAIDDNGTPRYIPTW